MVSLSVAGAHPLMQKVRSLASRLATCDTPVLIVGEHGTGKWDLARHIHQQSQNASAPFLSIDCAIASTDHLADTLEQANGGTVFFANIAALDTDLPPLLREVLDRRELRQPGSRSVRANFRLIASTETELFPQTPNDLLAQLCRISLFLPSLRERRSDIPLLIRHLLEQLASSHDGPPRRFSDQTVVYLWQYDWPGNLRELEEVVRQSATSASDGIVHPKLLPARIRASLKQGTTAGTGARDSLEDRRFLRSAGRNERNPLLLV